MLRNVQLSVTVVRICTFLIFRFAYFIQAEKQCLVKWWRRRYRWRI